MPNGNEFKLYVKRTLRECQVYETHYTLRAQYIQVLFETQLKQLYPDVIGISAQIAMSHYRHLQTLFHIVLETSYQNLLEVYSLN